MSHRRVRASTFFISGSISRIASYLQRAWKNGKLNHGGAFLSGTDESNKHRLASTLGDPTIPDCLIFSLGSRKDQGHPRVIHNILVLILTVHLALGPLPQLLGELEAFLLELLIGGGKLFLHLTK